MLGEDDALAAKDTLYRCLDRIEEAYGKAERIWVMDRGIPTEEVLAQMRASEPPTHCLVGTPKGRLGRLEKELASRPWEEVREGVEVKLLPREGELYVFAQSRDRVNKERSMRRRQLKKLWKRLHELRGMQCGRDELLIKLGQAKAATPSAWRLVQVEVSEQGALTFVLRRQKLREAIRREGRYLLRSNFSDKDPARLWGLYMMLAQIEEAFKSLKGDLAIRPIHHQLESRIEAHVFVAFLAYCLHATLRHRLHAPGLTPRAALEKLATIQMLDACFPTTDGRWLVFARYTQPEKDHRLLIDCLGLRLPAQRAPRITSDHNVAS